MPRKSTNAVAPVEAVEAVEIVTEDEAEALVVEAVEAEAVEVDYDGEYAPKITEAVEAWELADEAVTQSRTALGRIIGRAVKALIGSGQTAEEAQGRIMATVTAVTFAVEWETINTWVRAATVEDSLPEALHGHFSTEALKSIGNIPEEAKTPGGIDRATFAETLADEKVSSVRAIREAVKAEKGPGTSGPKKGNAAQAADAVKVLAKLVKALPEAEALLLAEAVEALSPEAVEVLVTLGIDCRTKCPKFGRKALTDAVEETFHKVEAVEAS